MRRAISAAVLGFCFLAICADYSRASAPNPPVAASTHKVKSFKLGTIARLYVFDDIFLASQPRPADFELLKKNGVKTVINLRHERENTAFDQPQLLAKLEIKYISVPWNGPTELTDEVFDRMRKLLNTAKRPIFLHCASANRVGAVWLPWRVLDGGITFEQALAEAKLIGLRTRAYAPKAQDYIKRHRK